MNGITWSIFDKLDLLIWLIIQNAHSQNIYFDFLNFLTIDVKVKYRKNNISVFLFLLRSAPLIEDLTQK